MVNYNRSKPPAFTSDDSDSELSDAPEEDLVSGPKNTFNRVADDEDEDAEGEEVDEDEDAEGEEVDEDEEDVEMEDDEEDEQSDEDDEGDK